MIIGIGTDVLEMDRLLPDYLSDSDPFLLETYSPAEREAAASREIPKYYFGTRFAGKEAVFKAFGISPNGVKMKEIEILNDASGAPYVNLYGKFRERAEAMGVARIHISLSYEGDTAVAFAVFESEDE